MIREQAYQIEVEALEPIRVGGAPDPLSGQDNPVATVGSRPTIPGSSLKGALRAEIEGYLILRYFDQRSKRWSADHEVMKPCMAATSVSTGERALLDEGKYRKNCTYPLSGDPLSVCPACYVLGAQGLVGFVKVPFLWCDPSPDALYSARIDRSSGTVAKGTNREYQLLPPGTRFTGTLFLLQEDRVLGWRFGEPRPLPGGPDRWLTKDWDTEKVLKELLLERLQAISYLGGYKSKGMGRVRVTARPTDGAGA